jgi:hypothetical protein
MNPFAEQILPCDSAGDCLNSPENRGSDQDSQCRFCKYAKAGGGVISQWKGFNSKAKHPEIEAEKVAVRKQRHQDAVATRAARDKGKRRRVKTAARAEKKTNDNIIKATKNSGRVNKDGDAVHAGRITIDTKLQSDRIHPIVDLGELDKIRRQARLAGNPIGALVLRNKLGQGVIVMDETDYTKFFTQIIVSIAKELSEPAAEVRACQLIKPK